ncbi:MAG TPA: rcc01693 family protein [Pseudolabrys sp.]|nr:rcc01693 family protein [Pseudolabrys sp.]
MQPFPWREAIGFGLGVLKLSPDAFWRLTPRELAFAIEGATGRGPPLDRAALADMMTRYPDELSRQRQR